MKIFISYRRADSKYVVDRIRDRLIVAYGDQAVFRDIESIPLGKNFSTVLDSETNGCDVMLVIIGPQWAGITDAQGNKRLFDPADFTRIEIETGLKRDEVLVIPVLVMNAPMPSAQDLPESLSNLTYRNAISVRNDPDFDNDIQRLILGINQTKGGATDAMPIEYFEPETICIPAGKFWVVDAGGGDPNYEMPKYEVELPSFRIGKLPVTNAQYEEFVHQTGKAVTQALGWRGRKSPDDIREQPVMGVSWYDALDYCSWLSGKTKRGYSLPNMAQLDRGYQAAHGCADILDNIHQWTCTLWGEKQSAPDLKYRLPWRNDGRNNLDANSQVRRVVCVYAKTNTADTLQLRSRIGQFPNDVGLPGARHSFRVVMNG